MKTLLQIEQLLDNDQLAEAIIAIQEYLKEHPNSSLEKHLIAIRSSFEKSNKEWQNGTLEKPSYTAQLKRVKKLLYRLINRLTPRQKTQSERPRRSTSRPPKSKGNILGRAIDKMKDFIIGGAVSSPSLPPVSVEEMAPFIPLEEEMSAGAEPPEDMDMETGNGVEPATAPSTPVVTAPKTPNPAAVSPFQKGKILYAIPNQMALATVSRCKIKIAPEQISDEELSSGLSTEEKAAATQESLKITSMMKVELQDAQEGDNFEIITRNSPEQPILPFMPTEWSFDITPLRPGHYALLLRVTAIIQVPGFGERPYDVAVLDRAIQVNTSTQATSAAEFEEQSVPDPSWNEQDEKAVEQALLQGRVDLAIARIVNFVQDKDEEFKNTLLLLQFRWNDNSNQLQNKLIAASDWDLVNNQVRFGITQLLEELKKQFAPGVTSPNMDWRSEEQLLKKQL